MEWKKFRVYEWITEVIVSVLRSRDKGPTMYNWIRRPADDDDRKHKQSMRS